MVASSKSSFADMCVEEDESDGGESMVEAASESIVELCC